MSTGIPYWLNFFCLYLSTYNEYKRPKSCFILKFGISWIQCLKKIEKNLFSFILYWISKRVNTFTGTPVYKLSLILIKIMECSQFSSIFLNHHVPIDYFKKCKKFLYITVIPPPYNLYIIKWHCISVYVCIVCLV